MQRAEAGVFQLLLLEGGQGWACSMSSSSQSGGEAEEILTGPGERLSLGNGMERDDSHLKHPPVTGSLDVSCTCSRQQRLNHGRNSKPGSFTLKPRNLANQGMAR